MMYKLLSMIVICLWMISPHLAFGASSDHARNALIVLVNDCSLEDLRTAGQLPSGEWLQKAAIGAMNLRTAGSKNDVNNLITISAGNRAVGVEAAKRAYLSTEKMRDILAVDWFRQVTGTKMKKMEILVPALPTVVEKNEGQPYTVVPGLLGQVLHKHSLSTAVWGNSDLGWNHRRQFAPMLAMDIRGIVDQGDISTQTLLHEPNHAYGMMTNYRFLLNQVHLRESKWPALSVIELGDLDRLYSLQSSIWRNHFPVMRAAVLKEINQFMNELVRNQQDNQLIIFFSPMVNRDAVAAKSLMAPIALIYPSQKGGTLSSLTTRRMGVIGNIDVAPTILSWLGLGQPAQMIGRPIHATSAAQQGFWEDWEKIKFVYATRPKILGAFIMFQLAIFLFCLVLWLCSHHFNRNKLPLNKAIKAAQFLLVFNLAFPFLFLLLPMLPYQKGWETTLILLLILGSAMTASIQKLPDYGRLLLVSFLCWCPALLDGIFNHFQLMKRSYLGYDPIIGARYYGVGNEYEGVIIGSSILTIVIIAEMKRYCSVIWKWGIAGICLLNLIYFAFPQWGTDAGGAIASAIAYAVVLVRLFHIPLSRKFLWKAGTVLIGAFLLFLYVNVGGTDSSHSHIGRAIEKLMAGDLKEIGHIIQRKWQMNLRLIRTSLWGKAFFFSLFIIILFSIRQASKMKQLCASYPLLTHGFFGISVGALAALMLNDSGIVAAATAILYAAGPMLYFGMQKEFDI
jgi:hypothetical protein